MSAASPTTWMPLYIGDYLKRTAHLNAAQSGAYLHLIMHYWSNGSLPHEDDRQMAQITKMEVREFRKMRATLAAFFDPQWRHERIDEELAIAKEKSEKAKEKGKAAAEARWNKPCMEHEPSIPDAMLGDAPSPSPSPSKKEEGGANAPAPQPKSRKKPSTPFPDGFLLSAEDRDFARKQGLNSREIETEFGKFRSHAKSNDRRLVDWSAGWENWCRKAVEYLGKTSPEAPNLDAYLALPNSPEFQAWRTWARDNNNQAFLRVLSQRELEGRGFQFQSRWPPQRLKVIEGGAA
jgi:uncharacterized protein YdaU (DUF1376 family)